MSATPAAAPPLDVTIAIVNWNRADLLEHCLRSVFASRGELRYEVVVVDNASTDESRSVVESEFPHVRLVCNDRNLGFARAQNQAIATARGRYVLALNNDATIHRDTMSHLLAVMDSSPEAALCGCPDAHQVTLGGFRAGAFHSFPSLSRTVAENVWALVRPPSSWTERWVRMAARDPSWRKKPKIEVAWVIGAILLMRRSALESVGGFDETFFLFGEEVDLCRRLRSAGWTILFAPGASIEHVGGASSALRPDVERLRRDGGARYFRKHHGAAAAAAFALQHWVLRERLLPWRRLAAAAPAAQYGRRAL